MKITSKFESSCRKCYQKIKIGTEIDWEKGKGASHIKCLIDIPPDAIRWSCSESEGGFFYYDGLVCRDYLQGIITVLAVGSDYCHEEGECEYHIIARHATEEEAASYRIREEAYEKRLRLEKRLTEIKSHIQNQGECPNVGENPSIRLNGEILLDTQDIYGGGDWFVITDDSIWYVSNNGGDGDYWGRNNIQTGGAGAIGYRIPRDAELETALRSLEEVLMPKNN